MKNDEYQSRFSGVIVGNIVVEKEGQSECLRTAFDRTGLAEVMTFEDCDIDYMFGFRSEVRDSRYASTNFQLAEELAYFAAKAWECGVELTTGSPEYFPQAVNKLGRMFFYLEQGKVWVDAISFGFGDTPFADRYSRNVEVIPASERSLEWSRERFGAVSSGA